MTAARRLKGNCCRVAAALLVSTVLASCTSTAEPALELSSTAFNDMGAPSSAAASSAAASEVQMADAAGPSPAISGEADMALPDQVAYLPTGKPAGNDVPAAETAVTAEAKPAAAAGDGAAVKVAALETDAAQKPAADAKLAIEPKKKSFLSSFFGASPASAAPAPMPVRQKAKPIVNIPPVAEAEAAPVQVASLGGGDFALPGVRQTALFEISRKSGMNDDSDVDLHEDEEDLAPVQLASAAGMARLAPNGLLTQRESVDVACLKPSLVRVLKTIEQHYGKKMVVTSGFRSPTYNRKVRGAKKSMHMYCAAADVQIPGVSKWELAQFARSMQGRGGVGTYCHTESVHIDVGPERDWNWRCRRRK